MTDTKNESHYQDVADLRAENEKLRAELAAARKALDEARAMPSDAEIEAWLQHAIADSVDAEANDAPEPSDIGTMRECFALTRSEIDQAVALMRRARAAPAPSADLRQAVEWAIEWLEYSARQPALAKTAHTDCAKRLRAALAASPEPSRVVDIVRAELEDVRKLTQVTFDSTQSVSPSFISGSRWCAQRIMEWIDQRLADLPSLAIPQPAPAADELQRLLTQLDKDEYTSVVWCETVERLLNALARKVGS